MFKPHKVFYGTNGKIWRIDCIWKLLPHGIFKTTARKYKINSSQETWSDASVKLLITHVHNYSVRKNDDGSRAVSLSALWLPLMFSFSTEVPKVICLVSRMLAVHVRVGGCCSRSARRRWAGWGEVSGWRASHRANLRAHAFTTSQLP